MKKGMQLILAIALVAVFTVPAGAETVSSSQYTTRAEVEGGMTINVELHKNSSTGAVVTSMDFGTLEDIGTGTLRSSPTGSTGTGNVTALVSANAQGLPYEIRQTGTALSNGTTNLPAGACTVVSIYEPLDNGGAGLPSGATLGTAGSWVATDKVLYHSDSAGALRTIQAIYSITDDDDAGSTDIVPLTQPGGIYNGVVTFTATTV